MIDRAAFLQAILAHPAEDAPRLIFADWLEEQGDSTRAEFIRVQCQLGGMLEDDPARKPLQKREKELLGPNATKWLPAFNPSIRVAWSFERGLLLMDVAGVHSGMEAFWNALAGVFHKLPTALQVRLEGMTARDWSFLAKQPWLRQIGVLRLVERWQSYTPASIRELLHAPALGNLGILECSLPHTTDLIPRLLAEADSLPKLTRLSLSKCGLGPCGFKELLAAPCCAALTHLELRGNHPELQGIRYLAFWPGLANVTHLDLGGCLVDAALAEALAQSPYLGNLVALGLNDNLLGTAGAQTLARVKTLHNLQTLLLRSNQLETEGVRKLLYSGAWPQLTSLDLTRNGVVEGRSDLQLLLKKHFGERAAGMLL